MDALHTLAAISRLHVVVIAALTTLTFGWLFTGEHHWNVAAVAAFDWFVLGLMNRVGDVKEDSINHVPGVDVVARHRGGLRIFGFAIMCVSFGLVHAYEPTLTLVRICFHLLGVFYNQPLLPGRVRLKQIYIVKNVATALGVLLTGFAYPLAKAHWGFIGLPIGIEGMTLLFAGAFLFLFALGFEVMFDLRDASGDAAVGIESLPVVLGSELAVVIIDRLLVFSALVLIVGFATHFVPWRITAMMGAPIAVLVVYKRRVKRGLRPSDCAALTWMTSLLLVVYHVWIWLRLPGIYA